MRGGGFATALGKLINRAKAQGGKVVPVVEMAGHFIMPNDAGNANNFAAFNQTKADIMATTALGAVPVDWTVR